MKNEYVTSSVNQTEESPELHPLVTIPSFLDPTQSSPRLQPDPSSILNHTTHQS